MNESIEINYNYSQLVNLLEEFKCELVKVIIKSGGGCNNGNCCCVQQGFLCKFNPELMLLVKPEEKTKVYIPLDAVAAISVVDKCNESKKNKEEISPKKSNDERNIEQEPQKEIDIPQDEEEAKADDEIKENNESEKSSRIYGYGRKINIDLLKDKSNFALAEINITELSLSISSALQEANNFIYYFHKDGINDRAVELLLSPSGPGYIESVTTNRAGTKAIIKGQGLVYLDSDNKGEYNFKLLVTQNRVVMKIEDGTKALEDHSKTVVGICDQEDNPFIIT